MRLCLTSIVALLLSASAQAAAPTPQEADLYAGLLSWAVKLSGYPQPAVPPTVEFVPQEFFNEHACGGHRCRVWGWYPNTGKNVVYVHEAARKWVADGSDPRSLLAASIIVHEFTHYLQSVNRGYAQYECSEALTLEHEAYGVQNAYLVVYGRYMQVGISMHSAGCTATSVASMAVSDRH